MALIKLNPKSSLNKAFLKVKPNRLEIEKFKAYLIGLLDNINETESEEFHKNLISEFLKKTYYDPSYYINTKGNNDLVIHNGKDAKDSVAVIIEAKKPTNKVEMLKQENINTKGFHELVLYFLRERVIHKNHEIKFLVATNINEWFIFDATVFEKNFAQNKPLIAKFIDFEAGRLSGDTTDFFYKEIAQPAIAAITTDIEFTYFDIRDYDKPLRNENKQDDNKLISLYKLLSPEHLLKLPFTNDSNSLDKRFYSELLHIIGLIETKEGTKKLIQRKSIGGRDSGSLLENAIDQIDSLDKLSRIDSPNKFGANKEERLFNIGLELVITWINRILFLKLLEAQLLSYHKGDKSYSFLNHSRISNFDDLNSLFFQVLARKNNDRNEEAIKLFGKVPYLNSSLFEPTEIEHTTLMISNLRDEKKIPIISSTVLKNESGKKRTGELSTLEYLFKFLDAYDFASEGSEEIQEENKALINASVLGLIFEKINGYKDGSFFTPGFVTMYMSRETIRRAVVQKFNEAKQWECKAFDELYDKVEDRKEANQIINSIKICDPAVGSGHFLVSALNEIIAIKSDLKVLLDREGKRLKEYQVEVVNDELIITDEDGEFFEYKPTNNESQRIQETLFHEKQTIIESCLFGVDINPNSVKICRLRLWIELLKNAYYKNSDELETLPNIDINIKCGNSLISRFQLDSDLKDALKKSKLTISSYKAAVDTYRNASSKEQKREMEKLIEDIKNNFRVEIYGNDPKVKKLTKSKNELDYLISQTSLFDESGKEKKIRKQRLLKLENEVRSLSEEIQQIKNNKVYEDAFEWRFEFPEVLNNEGDYVGFDVVIGNPPYIYRNFDTSLFKKYFNNQFKAVEGNYDLYKFFIERIGTVLKNTGHATYIVPNTFLSAKSYSKLRELFINSYEIFEMYDLGLNVFDDVLVENIIFSVKKVSKPINSATTIKIDRRKIKDIYAPENQYSIDLNMLYEKEGNFNIYLDLKTEKIINKIRLQTIPLSDICYCTVGINTGYIKKDLISSLKLDNSYHKVLNGKDIGPYTINWKGEWIKYDKDFVESFGELGRSLPPEYIFTNDKILVQRTRRGLARKLVCTYDSDHYYNLNRVSNIVLKRDDFSLFYIIALLNSKLIDYYFNSVFNEYEVKPLHLDKLPIKDIGLNDQKPFIELVSQLLSIKKLNMLADISHLEMQINDLVYKLYEIKEDEIKVVESNSEA